MKAVHDTHYVSSRNLKFQVGFLLAEGKGNHAESELDFPRVQVADDLIIASLQGKLRFSRTSEGVLVQGHLVTSLPAACNRCLKDVEVSLTLDFEELFVYPPRPGADFVVPETGLLDFAPLLREEILVSNPASVLCKPDCAGLCLECGTNLNDGPCTCQREAGDPRLAALRALQDALGNQ